jgi:hypothetical protein
MRRLLRLYPRAWRDRYEAEMQAVLDGIPFSPLAALDLVVCAMDAHLNPGGARPAPRLPLAARALALALVAAIAVPLLNEAPFVAIGPVGRAGTPFALRLMPAAVFLLWLLPAGVLVLAALAARRAGWILTGWFCALAALELVVSQGPVAALGYGLQPVLEPLRAAAAGVWHPAWFRFVWLFSAVVVAGCGALAALLLRRVGVPAWLGFAIGVALVGTADLWTLYIMAGPPRIWPSHPTWFRLSWVADAAQVASWAMLTAALLRRTGVPWWAGLVVGVALWTLLASAKTSLVPSALTGMQWISYLPPLWLLPPMLWAAVLASLLSALPSEPAVAEAAAG